MAKVKKEISVPKEIMELADFAGDLVYGIVAAKKNDGEIKQDELVSIVIQMVPKLSNAIDGIDKLKTEFKDDEVGFVLALAMQAQKIGKAFEVKE